MRISPEAFSSDRPLGFVVLEGVNGSGKSTLQKGLSNHLSEKSVPHLLSQEPGGTDFGMELRKMLLSNPSTSRSPLAEALLFTADRAEHLEKVIRPALEEKQLVILDRFYYSTIAFQGYGHGHSLKPLLKITEIVLSGIRPDLVILLDLDPEEGLKRNSDKEEEDCFEDEQLEFHRRLRSGFLKLADSLPEPFVVLDANSPKELLLAQATSLIERVIPK